MKLSVSDEKLLVTLTSIEVGYNMLASAGKIKMQHKISVLCKHHAKNHTAPIFLYLSNRWK
jgi:hypothetical protein